jgi:calcineurin-like phosphoesterase family protein
VIYFTSDEHFGHANIISLCNRPFKDLDHMTDELIKRHNAKVDRRDKVYHLGDFSFKEQWNYSILPALNGRHFLVSGNHDKCHPCHKKAESARKRYLQYGFVEVWDETAMYVDGRYVILNHLPYAGTQADPRYSQFRPKDEGDWLLHGHVHNGWSSSGRMINVGVDVRDFAPISLDEVQVIMRTAEAM